MSNCCGTKKKFKQEKVKQQEVKEKAGRGSFWKKLLRAFGLEVESKNLTGGN